MIKHLTRHGNSHALVIDKPILELLEIDEKTPLRILTDGERLFIHPVGTPRRRRALHAALKRLERQYGTTFRDLTL